MKRFRKTAALLLGFCMAFGFIAGAAALNAPGDPAATPTPTLDASSVGVGRENTSEPTPTPMPALPAGEVTIKPYITTWAPILPPPEAPSPQTAPYGTRLKELTISPPPSMPSCGFKWYWGGGDPFFPFKYPVDPDGGSGGDYQLSDPAKAEFHAISTLPFGGGTLEGNSYVYIKVNLINRVPVVTGDNHVPASGGNGSIDVTVTFTVSNAFDLTTTPSLSIGGVWNTDTQPTLHADLAASTFTCTFRFDNAAALSSGSDIMLKLEGDARNDPVTERIGQYGESSSYVSGPENTTLEANQGEDCSATFQGSYSSVGSLRLDGVPMEIQPIGPGQANLLFPSYDGVAGRMEEGSIKVTLFKEFLATLSPGRHALYVIGDMYGTIGILDFDLAQGSAAPAMIPQTGDAGGLGLGLALAALAGLGALLLRKRRG